MAETKPTSGGTDVTQYDNYPSVMAETDIDRLRAQVIAWTETAAMYARNANLLAETQSEGGGTCESTLAGN